MGNGIRVKTSSSGWSSVKRVYVKTGATTWTECKNILVKVSSTNWKEMWSYSYSVGEWSACSTSCGTGSRTRSVRCMKNYDNGSSFEVDSSFCTAYGIKTIPSSTEICNDFACTEVAYSFKTDVVSGWSIYTKNYNSGNYVWRATAIGNYNNIYEQPIWAGVVKQSILYYDMNTNVLSGNDGMIYKKTCATYGTNCIHYDSVNAGFFTIEKWDPKNPDHPTPRNS